MAQQTAVEWLVNILEKHYVNIDIKNTTAFVQAKQMEKEQIKEAFIASFLLGVKTYDPTTAEQYYNQTYNNA